MKPNLLPGWMLLATALFSTIARAQYDFISVPVSGSTVSCGPHGSETDTKSKDYTMNPKKNRYDTPSAPDFNNNLSLSDLIGPNAKQGAFTEGQAIVIEGYVDTVKAGEMESCNCDTKDADFLDTHIELVPTKGDHNSHDILIVEVTPRMRMIQHNNGIYWSTDTLKKTLYHHKVRITGWLMYDWAHITENWADAPKGKKNWRASCWEVHPITRIDILD